MRRLTPLLIAILAGGIAASAGLADGRKLGHSNTLSTYAVRFKAGTNLAKMTSAVNAAGGTVVADLHQVAAVAAASTDPAFPTRLSASGAVTSVFVDTAGSDSAHDEIAGPAPVQPALPDVSAGFDPWHAGVQWDDARMNVPPVAANTGAGVTVALVDSGVDPNQRETKPGLVAQQQFIPCAALKKVLDQGAIDKQLGLGDCGSGDDSGHGTFEAGRIAGSYNGFASNGLAPAARVLDQKAIPQVGDWDSTWVMAAMLDACDRGAHVVNLAMHVYESQAVSNDVQDYLLWVDSVNYCRSKGATLVASAGNDHVRVDRVNATVGGRNLRGLGIVSTGSDGFALTGPENAAPIDYRGLLVAPGGVPGVVMVSATGNVVADAGALVPAPYKFAAGLADQLAYYSNYGSRVDVAAPGGARAFNVPDYDTVGGGSSLGNGYGIFSTMSPGGDLCSASTGCFFQNGDAFAWLQGTSMATANVTGAVARLLAAHPELKGSPDAVLNKLRATARKNMKNATGPMSPSTAPPVVDTFGATCPGYCHVSTTNPISFADAYGAGIVDVGNAVK